MTTPVTTRLRRPPAPTPTGLVTRLAPRADDPDSPPPVAVQGTLALDVLHRPVTPAPRHLTSVRPRARLVPAPAIEPTDDADGACPPDPEVRAWAARFAQAVVEVAGGDRPLPQLLRWTSPRVYAELGRRVRVMAQSRPVEQRRRTVRPQVHSVHLCRPVPAVAEVSVHVRHGRRSRAIAARLELRGDRWTCTALRIG
ncbi:MAG: Rv3235 family protein [Actinomycetes bacterium]